MDWSIEIDILKFRDFMEWIFFCNSEDLQILCKILSRYNVEFFNN